MSVNKLRERVGRSMCSLYDAMRSLGGKFMFLFFKRHVRTTSIYECNNTIHISCVYTRVLTRVQLASNREPSSNPPMDCGLSQSGLKSGLGVFTLKVNPG